MPQLQRNFASHHVSTTGCVVAHDRWEQRKAQALDLVERRLLTVREASEHFGLPTNEIGGTRHQSSQLRKPLHAVNKGKGP